MKNLAMFIILILSGIWFFIGFKYTNNLLDKSIIKDFQDYSIGIFLAGMFVFGVLFGKILSQENKNIEKINEKNENIFVPEIKEISEETINYNQVEIIKDNIDIILDEREENYKHKINLKEEILKNNLNSGIKNNHKSYIDNTLLNVANNLAKQKKQNLQIIEGIGPKIEKLLNNNGIYSYKDLANSDIDKLKKILQTAGKRYLKLHNPSTWPKQASFAKKGEFNELQKYQDKLVKGVEI